MILNLRPAGLVEKNGKRKNSKSGDIGLEGQPHSGETLVAVTVLVIL